jgi:deoxycytidine triphosphate deaminase
MTILRYEDIEAAIARRELLTNATHASIQSASYDLRVGTIFREGQIINANHPDHGSQFSIQPGELVSIFTLEEVKLPADTAAFAFAMNALSSQGLLVLNPGHVDPGYEGPLTVKAINLRKTPISISRESPIFTVVFFKVGAHTTHPYTRNQPDRRVKETEFHATELERMPNSIADLLRASKDLPTVSSEQMERAIRGYWLTWLTIVLAGVAAVTGVIAVSRHDSRDPRASAVTSPESGVPSPQPQQPPLRSQDSTSSRGRPRATDSAVTPR